MCLHCLCNEAQYILKLNFNRLRRYLFNSIKVIGSLRNILGKATVVPRESGSKLGLVPIIFTMMILKYRVSSVLVPI